LDAIAFTTVAEELVERDASLASQNMKIDPSEHVIVLDNAIGKTRLFNIGMKADSSSRFPINYVLRKCFSVDNVPVIPSIKEIYFLLFKYFQLQYVHAFQHYGQ
jgi:replication factor A1